jgi:tetratricopeptide (TPR) repeat protein
MKKTALLTCLILNILISQSVSASDQTEPKIVLSLPDLSWALEIAEPGFIIEGKEIAPKGNMTRLQAQNKTTGVILSAFIEKAPKKGDYKTCREYYWNKLKQSPFQMEQINLYESGPMALVEYFIPEYLGVKVNQKNVLTYLSYDDYWIDIHMSIVNYKEGENDPFSSILKNIRIDSTYSVTASDFFIFGNTYFNQHIYKKAALQYEKALNLEKQNATLDNKMFIVLIDQLGMSYGISGDLEKSKQLYEWAITIEPEYPMFFYNLACTFAEMGDKENALHNLRQAYKFKEKMQKGEVFPDPFNDSSFKKCLKDKDFKTEVEKMK